MSFRYESPPRQDLPRRRQTAAPGGTSRTLPFLFSVLGALLGVPAYRFWPFGSRGDVTEPDAALRVETPRDSLWQIEQDIVKVAAKASKSVVHIRAQNRGEGSAAAGSGFIWDKINGKVYVVTNFHVIE